MHVCTISNVEGKLSTFLKYPSSSRDKEMETNPETGTSKFQSLCFRISSFIPFLQKPGAIFSLPPLLPLRKRSQGSVISSDIRPFRPLNHALRVIMEKNTFSKKWREIDCRNLATATNFHQEEEEEQFAFDVGGSFSLCVWKRKEWKSLKSEDVNVSLGSSVMKKKVDNQ